MCANDAAGSAKRMNYYVPIQETDNANVLSSNSSPKPRRGVRIMGRRYPLTATCYKHVEIGISAGTMSCVEIALGDNRGNQLILSYQTWKELICKRTEIDRLLQFAEIEQFWVQDLSVGICKFKNIKVIKLTLHSNTLFIKRETLNVLFNLELCINHMYSYLSDNLHHVNVKFEKFINVLQQNNIRQACYSSNWHYAAQAIRESDEFDADSLVDCELLACALPDIVYYASGKLFMNN